MSGTNIRADRKAAYMGLILGAIGIAIVVVLISKLTSRKFAGHEAEKPTASALR